jgi:glycosyltransferase involved in cell wall biosynthesis
MPIDYSFPSTFEGVGGLGNIARNHVECLKEHGALGEVYEGLTREGSGVNDWQHDTITALRRLRESRIHAPLDAWGNGALWSFLTMGQHVPPAARILQRASTHPAYQARALERELRFLGAGVPRYVNEWDEERGMQECSLAQVIVTPSEVAKATFPKEQQDKVVVVPFGTDPARFHPGEPISTSLGLASAAEGVRFGFLGGNWIRKGLTRLLDGWRLSEVWQRGATLDVAGLPQNMVADLTQQLHLPPGVNVQAVGRVPDQAAWMRTLDCFVLPSVEEGHAQVLVEAGATGLPVIASEACGHPFVDGKEGLLLKGPEPPTGEAVAAALRAMMDEGERKRMGRNHLDHVRAWGSWEHYRKRLWEHAYKPIAEASS